MYPPPNSSSRLLVRWPRYHLQQMGALIVNHTDSLSGTIIVSAPASMYLPYIHIEGNLATHNNYQNSLGLIEHCTGHFCNGQITPTHSQWWEKHQVYSVTSDDTVQQLYSLTLSSCPIGFTIREQVHKSNAGQNTGQVMPPVIPCWRHKCFHFGVIVTASVARCWCTDVMALSHYKHRKSALMVNPIASWPDQVIYLPLSVYCTES